MSQTRLQTHSAVTEALQDGIYRAMLQVEYGKPGANEKLCRALAQVWNLAAAGVQTKFIRWRSAITPIALSMLAESFTDPQGNDQFEDNCTGSSSSRHSDPPSKTS